MPEEQKKKFLQEGRILKQYEHPNIVRYSLDLLKRNIVLMIYFLQVYRDLCPKATNNDCNGAGARRLSFELFAHQCR